MAFYDEVNEIQVTFVVKLQNSFRKTRLPMRQIVSTATTIGATQNWGTRNQQRVLGDHPTFGAQKREPTGAGRHKL